MSDEKKPAESKATGSSWTAELPKYLTAIGTFIAAGAALLTALNNVGAFRKPSGLTGTTQAGPTVVAASTPSSPSVAIAPSSAADSGALPSGPVATTLPPGLLLADDFADPTSGWLTDVTPESDKGYTDGEYRISIFQAEHAAWGHLLQIHDWKDVAIDVDARLVDGSSDNQYGIVARYDRDDENFYLFTITSAGEVMVEKRWNDEWMTIVEATRAPAVRKGNLVNHLRVECLGDALLFYANGELLVQVRDATFPSGDVGLLAAALDEPPIVVAFDNIRVRSLE